MEILRIITELAKKRAPSGMEEARAQIFKKEMDKLLEERNLSVKKDEVGNYYVKIKSSNPKAAVAILAHIDEIGGTIRNIKKNGCLEFSKRGGYEGRWLISKEVKILNREGKWIKGIIAGRSAHATPDKLRVKEKIDPRDLEIFVGAKNSDEVKEKYKLHIGAPLIFDGNFGVLNPGIDNDLIAGYSMDNLAALTCLVVLAQKIKGIMTDFGSLRGSHDVYLVATTREEIGTEGAHYFIGSNKISTVLGIDIGLVADFSGAFTSSIQLQEGPVIVWQDSQGGGVYDYNLCKKLTEIAEKNKIPNQAGVFENYGSDAGKAQKWHGIPSALIGIPTMFSHNVPEITSLKDIDITAELVFQYIKSLK